MDDIKTLEEIGLYKVSQETHIEQKYLEYMINGEFEKLNRINTLGFVKILSREYKLDLSEWIEEFEAYWSENRATEETEELFIVVQDESKSFKKVLLFFLLVIAIALSAFGYYLYKQENKQVVQSYTPTLTYDTKEIIEETQEEIKRFEANNSKQIELIEDNETTAVLQEELIESENNDTNNSLEKEPILQEVVATEKVSETFDNQVIIIPKSELWVGVIYLDNFTRRSFLGEGNFSIDISRDQIITTGHGSFDVLGDSLEMNFNRQSPIRFEIKESQMLR